MSSTKKNPSIEFFRFYFLLVIALGHFNSCEGLMVQGFSPVEFFFVLSGFFIYKSVQKHPQLSVYEYTLNKVKRFFPEYFTALFICTIIHFYSYWHNGMKEDTIMFLQSFISEAMFLQGTGFLPGNINYPCWYLSVLIIGGAFVFAVIKYINKQAITILLPCVVLFSYTLLFTQFDTIEQWGSLRFISLPLLRGIAGMSLGAVIGSVEINHLFKQTNMYLLVFLTFLAFVILNISIFSGKIVYPFVIFLYSLLIVCCFINGNLFNAIFDKPVFYLLGEISFEMLIFHTSIMYVSKFICTALSLPVYVTILMYIFLLVLFSIVVKKMFSRIAIIRK